MLGRDMVATWLNYLANNQTHLAIALGTDDGVTSSPRE
jgi:hypothetical protein